MRRLGLTDAKTFSKGAAAVWADYSAAFPKGSPKNATFMKASAEARTACASVNMKTFNEFVMFPTGPGGTAKIRETKNGVFVSYGRAGARFKSYHDEIILSKKGDHIQYGAKLAKRNRKRQDNSKVMHTYGTLKTHAYKVGGEMVSGFMRDTARTYENPLGALMDDRYANDKAVISEAGDDDREDGEGGLAITKGFVKLLQETNGVAALILTRS